MSTATPPTPPAASPALSVEEVEERIAYLKQKRPDAPRRRLQLAHLLLLVVLGVVTWLAVALHLPAHGGTDQNGYLTTARLLAEQHALSFPLESPWQFAGRMMIDPLAPDSLPPVSGPVHRIYAKYPFGFPLLAAAARTLAGPDAMFWVNPVCLILAIAFSFLLFRQFLSDFFALAATILLAFNPVALAYANDANSHAPTLLCVTLGFFLLFSWDKNPDAPRAWARGLLGGFALGYAATIRYTEALLLLPVLYLAVANLRWNARRVGSIVALLLGYGIPTVALCLVCWKCFGKPWTTGYAFCGEETGFAWSYFWGDDARIPPRQGNWETIIEQFNNLGLFTLIPLTLLGFVRMSREHLKTAVAFALWIVPSLTIYAFYYWAPVNIEATSYLRFFLTIFPACVLLAMWFLERAWPERDKARAVAVAAVVALAAGFNLYSILPQLENQFAGQATLLQGRRTVEAHFPQGSVLIADESLCNYLDDLGGYHLYSTTLFDPHAVEMFKRIVFPPADQESADEPNPLQRSRARFYLNLLADVKDENNVKPKPGAARDALGHIVEQAFDAHQRVGLVLRADQFGQLKNMFPRTVSFKNVDGWTAASSLPRMNGMWQRLARNRPLLARAFANRNPRRDFGTWLLVEILPAPAPLPKPAPAKK